MGFRVSSSYQISIHHFTLPSPSLGIMGHPDLEIPGLPDASEDLSQDFDWPEAGPSKPAANSGIVGPVGAKAIAAMTGAMTTSLLSEFAKPCIVMLTVSDSVRRSQDTVANRAAPLATRILTTTR